MVSGKGGSSKKEAAPSEQRRKPKSAGEKVSAASVKARSKPAEKPSGAKSRKRTDAPPTIAGPPTRFTLPQEFTATLPEEFGRVAASTEPVETGHLPAHFTMPVESFTVPMYQPPAGGPKASKSPAKTAKAGAGVPQTGYGDTQADVDSWTPLHWAAFKGQKDEVLRLINEGADVNAKSANGWSPLFCAVFENFQGLYYQLRKRRIHRQYIETVNLLIASGADVNAVDRNGITVLDAALLCGQADFSEIIRAHGGKKVSEPKQEKARGLLARLRARVSPGKAGKND